MFKHIENDKGAVLVTGLMFLAVISLLSGAVYVTTTGDVRMSARYSDSRAAFYQADAGVQYVLAHLRSNTVTYPTSGNQTTVTVSTPTGFNFNSSVVIQYVSPNRYKFQMTGTGPGNASQTIETHVIKTTAYPQGADGAVAMYGGGPAVAFKVGAGGGYNIDGRNYPVPTANPCTGSHCNTTPSSIGGTTGLYTVMTPTLTGNVNAHLGGDPQQALGGGKHIDSDWSNFVDHILAENLYSSTFGTKTNPAVTVVPSGAVLNGNGHYAGILIVDDGGELNLTGTCTFEGIIILRGTGDVKGSGTGNVFGSVITIGHNAKLIDVTGSVNLYYSSEALTNLSNINSLNSITQKAWRVI